MRERVLRIGYSSTLQLLAKAKLDTDLVSVFVDGTSWADADCAIFIVKGSDRAHAVYEMLARQGRARPMHPDWARSLRNQCKHAGAPFHFKQHGAWVSVSMVAGDGPHFALPDGATVRKVGKKAAGRLLDGVLHDGFPA